MDVWLFRQIYGWPQSWAPLFVGLSEGNKNWAVRLLFLALFVTCLVQAKLRRAALVGVSAWLLSDALCNLLKSGLKGLRPTVELATEVVARVEGGHGYGTASAHAASTMAVAVAFMMVDRRWGTAWLVVSLMTGLARIYVGVHFPSQVLLGWAVGALVAWSLTKLSLRIWPGKRPAVEPDVSESPQGAD
ncbi:MAG: phosphatase PAP2 family protein [Fimbriimonadaceae bacterium]|nr:phosphatase PAP2 family protein [Fimbriimonadaceae bacterium]